MASHSTHFYLILLSLSDIRRYKGSVTISIPYNVSYKIQANCSVKNSMRSPSFSEVAPYHWITSGRRFETTWWSHLQGSKCPGILISSVVFRPLKIRPSRHLEMSDVNYLGTRQPIPEKLKSQVHRYESVKSRKKKSLSFLWKYTDLHLIH